MPGQSSVVDSNPMPSHLARRPTVRKATCPKDRFTSEKHPITPQGRRPTVQALTPEEFYLLLKAIPDEHRLMVETAIETGMRWGELVALRPRHVDFLRKTLSVEDTIVELSRKASPTGERYLHKPLSTTRQPERDQGRSP